jgi:hypothetical protein
MAKKKPVGCNCLKLAEKQLRRQYGATFSTRFVTEQHGSRLDMKEDGPLLAVEWHEGEKKPKGKSLPVAMCTFCQFCGKRKP